MWGSSSNIFTIPSTGGTDCQLTHTTDPTDGPELSPDGQWIYFNSELRPDGKPPAGAGHAQVFRMRPDGTEVSQLTFDERVNWFPHLSPDGRTVLVLSFPPGTTGHPGGRDVRLRTMGPAGENLRDVLSLRGGQGTVKVNSWAPTPTGSPTSPTPDVTFGPCRGRGRRASVRPTPRWSQPSAVRSTTGDPPSAARTRTAAALGGPSRV